jgi:hypothetical protein
MTRRPGNCLIDRMGVVLAVDAWLENEILSDAPDLVQKGVARALACAGRRPTMVKFFHAQTARDLTEKGGTRATFS